MIDTFRFGSREEVIAFQNMLEKYLTERSQLVLSYLSLVPVYDKLQTVNNGSRIFSSYFDLVIDIVLLRYDLCNAMVIWNTKFSQGKLERGSIYDSNEKFSGKIDMHRYYTSYVLRYRAIWDKIMGLLILIFSPLDYTTFYGSKTKKASFKKIAGKCVFTQSFLSEIIEIIDGPLKDFDDIYRTPEAHGTGTLRKWTFLMHSVEENPAVEFLAYWNMLNQVMYKIGFIFDTM